MRYHLSLICVVILCIVAEPAQATTKGLSQIVTPDLQPEGDLSLSLQAQDQRIANPYQAQAELGVTDWAEVAVFQGFKPNEEIFGTEIGLLRKEPCLLSIGFVNWSPRSHVDPQPYIEGGYYNEHHKIIVGAIHVDYKNEAILGYAYDFNKQWRVQVDFQSGSENSSTIGFTWNITPDFQVNPALYVTNDKTHDLLGTSSSPTRFTSGRKTRKIRTRAFPAVNNGEAALRGESHPPGQHGSPDVRNDNAMPVIALSQASRLGPLRRICAQHRREVECIHVRLDNSARSRHAFRSRGNLTA